MTGRGTRRGALLALLAAGAIALAGCGGSDDDAGTTTQAPPSTEAPAVTVEATTAPDPTTEAPPATAPEPTGAGDVAAGKATFESAPCASCHPGAGTRAGVGPALQGAGLTATEIETTIVNGRGPMPAGLISGQELTDVVAYVESIQ